jgi:hypothetical protein
VENWGRSQRCRQNGIGTGFLPSTSGFPFMLLFYCFTVMLIAIDGNGFSELCRRARGTTNTCYKGNYYSACGGIRSYVYVVGNDSEDVL